MLTGLPNRSAFNKKLDQEIEASLSTGLQLAVLCLDLDHFKEINDLFGHAAGDRMLQVVAGRISALLDSSQMMARLSGDEFAILVPGLSGPAVAGRIAENIMDDLEAANASAETDTLVSTSIGIAICPDDATDRNALLTHADTALYRAKNDGRGVYRFFEAAMGEAALDRRLLEHDLRVQFNATSSDSSISPRGIFAPATLSGSKRCCVGRIRRAASSCRARSSRWPRRPV